MLADVGLVGFPNVGKSTLISIVSSARPKIANYHFTTLDPALGVVRPKNGEPFVMADIPGIIEGASEGIGLGIEFLKHVERTRLLLHVIDVAGSEGRDPVEDFNRINEELKKYSQKLASKEQIVVANKMDIANDEELIKKLEEKCREENLKLFKISAATRQGIDELIEYVAKELSKIPKEEIVQVDEMYDKEEEIVDQEWNVEVENRKNSMPIFKVSAVTKQGLEELIEYIAKELKNIPKEAVVEIDETYNDEDEYIDQEWFVKKEDNCFKVFGAPIERLMSKVNIFDIESRQYLQRILRQLGVMDKLKEMGIKQGDFIEIDGYQLEYSE